MERRNGNNCKVKQLSAQWFYSMVMFLFAVPYLLLSCSKEVEEAPQLEVSDEEVYLGNIQNGSFYWYFVEISSNTMWKIESQSSSWLSFSTMSGKGDGKVEIYAMGGQTESKEGRFFIKTIDGKISKEITVYLDVSRRAMPDETITVNGVSFKMIGVKGGIFKMGATEEQGSDAYSNEKPVHYVILNSYSIGQTEVTQELWEAVMDSNPSYFEGVKRPVEKVSWDDCQLFISELNKLTGKKFRLPTEAEWEYAARGGTKSKGFKYAGSNTITDIAWCSENSNKGSGSLDYGTHDVATKQPNELNLYDMSGNVREWCQDWKEYYSSSSTLTNPTGPTSGSYRVYRGGCWYDWSGYCRVSYRDEDRPSYSSSYLGLRLAH